VAVVVAMVTIITMVVARLAALITDGLGITCKLRGKYIVEVKATR